MSLTAATAQFKFVIPFDEFVLHLKARADHHNARAEYWAIEAEKQDADIHSQLGQANNVTERLDIKRSSVYDNATLLLNQARAKAADHVKKAKQFDWYARHTPPGDVMLTFAETGYYEFTD